MTITVNSEQAYDLLVDCIQAQKVPMLTGQPGTGKSSIVKLIAKVFNLQLIDMRLSQCDPTDLSGFPQIDSESGKASYMPMSTFPLETDAIPKGKSGWLLFLDEFNSAPLAVQAASYKLVLDRMVGLHKLHPNTAIICAGNLDTDNAIVNRMSTAMQSRLVHIELVVNTDIWLNWAATADIDHRVKSYINFKPNILQNFDPDHNDKTFACARTWEFVSDFIKKWGEIPKEKLPLLAGTIGEGVAREFMGFCKIYQNLPTIQDIIKSPLTTKMPTEPSTLYAISGSLAHNANNDNSKPIVEFIERMPLEFQVITLKDIRVGNPEMKDNPDITSWCVRNATALMG